MSDHSKNISEIESDDNEKEQEPENIKGEVELCSQTLITSDTFAKASRCHGGNK